MLEGRRHRGPLVVQRPFYPEGRDPCHVYVVHPPGGLTGGDELEVSVRVGAGASALVTTPAATKVYRTPGRPARQVVRARVEEGAALEWLPQETLTFDACRFDSDVEITADRGARVVVWDVVSLGMPHPEGAFRRGWYQGRLALVRQGVVELVDRTRVEARGEVAQAAFGLGGERALGTMVALPVSAEGLALARTQESPSGHAGVTLLGDVLVARAVGPDAADVRRWFAGLWASLRPEVTGRAKYAPRIWAT